LRGGREGTEAVGFEKEGRWRRTSGGDDRRGGRGEATTEGMRRGDLGFGLAKVARVDGQMVFIWSTDHLNCQYQMDGQK
jgi:hypothetical protein